MGGAWCAGGREQGMGCRLPYVLPYMSGCLRPWLGLAVRFGRRPPLSTTVHHLHSGCSGWAGNPQS